MRRLKSLWLVMVVLVIALAACGGDDSEPDESPIPPATTVAPPLETPGPTATPRNTPMPTPEVDDNPLTRATLRVVHASPDLPPVNVYLDGQLIGRGLARGQYTNAPLAVQSGSYLLRIVTPGEDPDNTPPLLAQPLDLPTGTSIIAVLAGDATALQIITTQENLDPLPNTTARVTAIHAVARGAVFNLQENNRSLAAELDYGMVSEPVEVDSGAHTFDFVSGPDQLASAAMNLAAGTTHTLVLAGSPGAYQVINLNSTVNTIAQVRAIHASPDLPPVDVYLDDDLLAEEIDFREWSDWLTVRALSYQLRVLPAGDPDATPILSRRVTLRSNAALSIVLIDEAAQLRAVEINENLGPLGIDSARFTFVHAAPGPIRLEVESLSNSAPELQPISFGTASQPITLLAGREQFYFTTTESGETREIDMINEREYLPGYAYTVIVTGYPGREALVIETPVETDETLVTTEEGADPDTPATTNLDTGTGVYQIRFINALADDTVVDVFIDDEPIFDTVAPRAVTGYYRFDNEPEELVIRKTGQDSVLLTNELALVEPAYLTLFAFRGQDGQVRFTVAPDTPVLISNQEAQVRILHAAPQKPPLTLARMVEKETPEEPDIEAMPETGPEYIPLVDPFSFGEPSDPYVLLAGTYDIHVQEANTEILVMTMPDTTIMGNSFYDLIILPDASGLSVEPFFILREGL